MTEETNQVAAIERMVLNKYDGNLTDEQMESGEFQPVETIILNSNGEVIEHYVKEDNDATN